LATGSRTTCAESGASAAASASAALIESRANVLSRADVERRDDEGRVAATEKGNLVVELGPSTAHTSARTALGEPIVKLPSDASAASGLVERVGCRNEVERRGGLVPHDVHR
jgi:hypothetical protein